MVENFSRICEKPVLMLNWTKTLFCIIIVFCIFTNCGFDFIRTSGSKKMYEREKLRSRLAKYFVLPDKYKCSEISKDSPFIFYNGEKLIDKSHWEKRRAEIKLYWINILGIPSKDDFNPKITIISQEKSENFTRQKVNIEYAPKHFFDAYLLIPENIVGKMPAALIVYYTPEEGAGLNPKRMNEIDFGYKLAKRGIVSLCIGTPAPIRDVLLYPNEENCSMQPLAFLAYIAENCRNALTALPYIDSSKIGIAGHSMGGKWAMFAACLNDGFSCGVWSDPGIVFDETKPDVNYWEPWYLGYEKGFKSKIGIPDHNTPRRGAYKALYENAHDLVELHYLMAPRPFFVAGGSEDPESRWCSLKNSIELYKFLGYENKIGMANRSKHFVDAASSDLICDVLEYFLKYE